MPTIIPTMFIPATPIVYHPTYILPTRIYLYPTAKPSSTPIPTIPILPSPIPPTAIPKKIGDLPISDPLNQPYYKAASSICYTPAYFYKFYGGGLTPNSCYNNIRTYVEANLVNVNLLGRNVQVHKNAAPYFQAVADELAVYQKADGTFEFPSKTYKIITLGTYVFRCNTAQSKGNCYDPCSTGWVIGDHAFGIAVDINWDQNCVGCKNYDMPSEIVNSFERWGFRWGGRYDLPIFGNSTIDPMHFEFLYDMCKGL